MVQRVDAIEVGGAGAGNVTVNIARSPIGAGFKFSTFPLSGLTVEAAYSMKLASIADIQLAPADQKTVILATTGALPPASASVRGAFFVFRGATGVPDTLQVCLKSALDTYSWKVLATG